MCNNHASQQPPVLVSIIPDLVGGKGHVYSYHQAVGKAAGLIDWKHLAAVAPDTLVKDLPSNWNSCLSSDNLEWEIPTLLKLFKIKSIYIWARALAQYLRQEVTPSSGSIVIFLERFIISQLLATTLALLLIPKDNLSVWLLYRRDTHNQKNRIAYKILNNMIKKILPPGRLQILTDSELLSKSLSDYFCEPVTVMPIPHTEVTCYDTFPKPTNEILCWWAGPPRVEKGLDVIQLLMSSACEGANQLRVIAAESSELVAVLGGVKVQLIKDNLTRLEYLQWLATCDVCLLPYNSYEYRERTSSIFAECVIAGKIPLVTRNTWMAGELSKYDLTELILDWHNSAGVIQKILKLAEDCTVKAKINRMQQDYLNFHSVQTYANKMKELLQKAC
jgi:hypothetical protein